MQFVVYCLCVARLVLGHQRTVVSLCVNPLFQVGGYAGLLLAAPTVLYEIIAYVVPGLTRSERQFLAPVVFGSSILFYLGCVLCLGVGGGVGACGCNKRMVQSLCTPAAFAYQESHIRCPLCIPQVVLFL